MLTCITTGCSETPQRVEWLPQHEDYPFLLNTYETLICRVFASWLEEFSVSVLLIAPDGT